MEFSTQRFEFKIVSLMLIGIVHYHNEVHWLPLGLLYTYSISELKVYIILIYLTLTMYVIYQTRSLHNIILKTNFITKN